jgi:outer membrane protein TolC
MNDTRTRAVLRRAATASVTTLLAVMLPLLAASAQSPATPRDTTPVTAAAAAAGRPLSLDEALRLAGRESEALQIARAGVTRAEGQQRQARSQYFPQINSSLAYNRTLRSQFSALASAAPATPAATQAVWAPVLPDKATPALRAGHPPARRAGGSTSAASASAPATSTRWASA